MKAAVETLKNLLMIIFLVTLVCVLAYGFHLTMHDNSPEGKETQNMLYYILLTS